MVRFLEQAHKVVRIIEPWSILLSAVGLTIAAVGLIWTYSEIERERNLREAILLALFHERLEAARELDKRRGRIARYDTGQVRVLEIMVKSGMVFPNLYLSGVNLSGADISGIDLGQSNLDCSVLEDVDLSKANLSGTKLKGVDFTRTILVNTDFSDSSLAESRFENVDLSGANFRGTNLYNTEFVDVDLRSALYVPKDELEEACGKRVTLPRGWTIYPCNDEQDRQRRKFRDICKRWIHGN